MPANTATNIKTRIHNFSAGPGILPREVLQKAAEACVNFKGTGLSLLEMSHRSNEFEPVMEEARSLALELLGLDKGGYQAIFLGGGASLQFTMVPMNLLREGGKACYVNTGVWASKAIKEAKLFGQTEVVASSEKESFTYIPEFPAGIDGDYLHITSNNTIYGTQYQSFPKAGIPVVCDMSSDIFSRQVDASQFSLIYAGAQKNMGPAGATLIIIKEELLGRSGRKLPSMLDYKVHIDGGSMYNTPPVFPVYVSLLTMQWLKANGGIRWIEELNNRKASLLYQEIDRNRLFRGTAREDSRSKMNVTFVMEDPELESAFAAMTDEAGLSGLKGHRSVGGFRASIYNALPLESVERLIEVMQDFEKKHA